MVKYLEEPYETFERVLPWQAAGLSWTATGYGMKIPSTQCVRLNGRVYRVYVTQISNAGSAWIKVKGEKLFLR